MDVTRYVTSISRKGRRIIINSYTPTGTDIPRRHSELNTYKLRPNCGVDMAMQMWNGSGADKELLITWLNEQCQTVELVVAEWRGHDQITTWFEAEAMSQIKKEQEMMMFYGTSMDHKNIAMKAKARYKTIKRYVNKIIK